MENGDLNPVFVPDYAANKFMNAIDAILLKIGLWSAERQSDGVETGDQ
jgi:hypothetical protein